jgi:hypothetical protein
MSNNRLSTELAEILRFLRGIGIPVGEGRIVDSFLPGVRIEHGTLVFDRASLRWPGDLLHEAGHIALTPASSRPSLSDTLDDAAGDPEAIAWSYAAIVAIGIDPEVLFHPGGYKGQSAGLLMSFALGVYPGAYGLSKSGLTLVGADAIAAGVAPYPHMIRWLRE